MWLLAALVFAQSAGASVLATLGPAHAHKARPEVSGLESFDLRRAPAKAASGRTHVLTAFGHFHSDGQRDRHHHRGDDDSVVLLDSATSLQADVASDATLAAALAGIGMLPASMGGIAPVEPAAPGWLTAWPSLTHNPEPLEKPPRPV